jgi:hypothetical protein
MTTEILKQVIYTERIFWQTCSVHLPRAQQVMLVLDSSVHQRRDVMVPIAACILCKHRRLKFTISQVLILQCWRAYLHIHNMNYKRETIQWYVCFITDATTGYNKWRHKSWSCTLRQTGRSDDVICTRPVLPSFGLRLGLLIESIPAVLSFWIEQLFYE